MGKQIEQVCASAQGALGNEKFTEGTTAMRRKSNARNLFWPSLAAIAVILVLLSASHLQDWLGIEHSAHSIGVNTQQTSHAIGSPLPRPTPLSANDKSTLAINSDLAGPQDARSIEVDQVRTIDVDTHAMLISPTTDVPVVTLLAPVMDEDQELAGLSPDGNGFTDGVDAQAVSMVAGPESWLTTAERSGFSSDVRKQSALDSKAAINEAAGEERNYLLGRDGRAVPPEESRVIDERYSLSLGSPENETLSEAESDDVLENKEVQPDSTDGELPLDSKPAGVAWPRTPALENDLKQLQEQANEQANTRLSSWIQQVRTTLLELQAIPSITDSRAGAVIAELRSLADQGIEYGEMQLEHRASQIKTLRTAHALLRRTVIWNAVWLVGERSTGNVVSLRLRDVDSPIAAVDGLRARVSETGDPQGWDSFLLLSEITNAAQSPDSTSRRLVAQRLLSRVSWDGLSEKHREWLDDDSVRLLTSRVRPWADAPVDYAALLAQLERQEADALDMGGIDVATAVQNLRFSENERASNVARAINDYYRNANLRMAVSADLLRQLLPDVPTKTTAIRQTLVGMPVRGTGVINSQLGLDLLPTEGAWNFSLTTDGVIAARTGTSQWPVQITNRSNSHFNAVTRVRIDNHNFNIGDTQVSVASKVKLQKLKTEFDGFPVIESLVRAVAMSRYEETAPVAKRQSERITKNQIREEISGEVETEINRASDQLASRLLGPLGRLQLDPLVVDLDTTETRLSARYRVAGEWQLSAFTPRPRALSNSVLSMQVHQSLLNNTFEQLLPSEEPQPIREMMGRVLGIFGVDPSRLPGELPENVQIRFASTRPVTVEIEDGLLWLTLRVVRLHDDAGLDLNYFVVRAAFRPEFDGMNARLVRDGVIQISGPRLGIRERLPVRAIFTKVLADERPLPLVSEDLAGHPAAKGLKVGMLELVDGWLCMAICPDENDTSSDAVIARTNESKTR